MTLNSSPNNSSSHFIDNIYKAQFQLLFKLSATSSLKYLNYHYPIIYTQPLSIQPTHRHHDQNIPIISTFTFQCKV